MNGQDPDSGGESAGDVARADRQDVVVRKFTVEPPAIVTGGSITVTWHVVFAETVDAELHLNGQLVTTIGHKAFAYDIKPTADMGEIKLVFGKQP